MLVSYSERWLSCEYCECRRDL